MSARPWFTPTARQRKHVVTLAERGVDHAGIAGRLGISTSTLWRFFRYELDVGACRARAEIIEALYEAALKGSASAARLYLHGWRRRGG